MAWSLVSPPGPCQATPDICLVRHQVLVNSITQFLGGAVDSAGERNYSLQEKKVSVSLTLASQVFVLSQRIVSGADGSKVKTDFIWKCLRKGRRERENAGVRESEHLQMWREPLSSQEERRGPHMCLAPVCACPPGLKQHMGSGSICVPFLCSRWLLPSFSQTSP